MKFSKSQIPTLSQEEAEEAEAEAEAEEAEEEEEEEEDQQLLSIVVLDAPHQAKRKRS